MKTKNDDYLLMKPQKSLYILEMFPEQHVLQQIKCRDNHYVFNLAAEAAAGGAGAGHVRDVPRALARPGPLRAELGAVRARRRRGGLRSGRRVLRLRRGMNFELNFPPNFEGLVLGSIDADFCK